MTISCLFFLWIRQDVLFPNAFWLQFIFAADRQFTSVILRDFKAEQEETKWKEENKLNVAQFIESPRNWMRVGLEGSKGKAAQAAGSLWKG